LLQNQLALQWQDDLMSDVDSDCTCGTMIKPQLQTMAPFCLTALAFIALSDSK